MSSENFRKSSGHLRKSSGHLQKSSVLVRQLRKCMLIFGSVRYQSIRERLLTADRVRFHYFSHKNIFVFIYFIYLLFFIFYYFLFFWCSGGIPGVFRGVFQGVPGGVPGCSWCVPCFTYTPQSRTRFSRKP